MVNNKVNNDRGETTMTTLDKKTRVFLRIQANFLEAPMHAHTHVQVPHRIQRTPICVCLMY